MNVIHATATGTQAFAALNLETGETAVIVTTPERDRARIADRVGERLVRGTRKDTKTEKMYR